MINGMFGVSGWSMVFVGLTVKRVERSVKKSQKNEKIAICAQNRRVLRFVIMLVWTGILENLYLDPKNVNKM